MNKYNPEIHKRHSIRLKNFDYSREGLYFITICCKNREHLFGEIVDGKMILNEIGEIANDEWMKTTTIRGNVILHHFVVMPNHFHAIVEITHRDNDDNISNIRRGVLHTPFDNDVLHTPFGNGVTHTPFDNSDDVLHTPFGNGVMHTPFGNGVMHTPFDNSDDVLHTPFGNGVMLTPFDNGDDVLHTPFDNGISHTPDNNDDGNGVLHTPNDTNNNCTGVMLTPSDDDKGVCNTPLRSPSQTLGAIVRGYKSAVSKMAGFSVWQRNYQEHIIRNENAYIKISEYIKNNPQKWDEDCFYL